MPVKIAAPDAARLLLRLDKVMTNERSAFGLGPGQAYTECNAFGLRPGQTHTKSNAFGQGPDRLAPGATLLR